MTKRSFFQACGALVAWIVLPTATQAAPFKRYGVWWAGGTPKAKLPMRMLAERRIAELISAAWLNGRNEGRRDGGVAIQGYCSTTQLEDDDSILLTLGSDRIAIDNEGRIEWLKDSARGEAKE